MEVAGSCTGLEIAPSMAATRLAPVTSPCVILQPARRSPSPSDGLKRALRREPRPVTRISSDSYGLDGLQLRQAAPELGVHHPA